MTLEEKGNKPKKRRAARLWIVLRRYLVFVSLIVAIAHLFEHRFADYFVAFADSSVSSEVAQVARENQWNIAEEIAQENLKGQFGLFNLFIIFFVTLGPLKVIPTFAQLTQRADRSLKRQLALISAAVSTIVIVIVVLIGRNLLEVWRIQLPALMIAGGILLSLVALRLILTQYAPLAPQAPPPENPELNWAIVPLAFPTILPPFGIAIALTLMIVATELGLNSWVVIALLLLLMLINFLSMLAADPILKFIRPVTLKILGFTLGVMQFALGIQFILIGIEIQVLVIQILLKGQ